MDASDCYAGDCYAGPDPTRALSLADLSRELNLLRARAARGTRSARVSLEVLARRVGEPKSSIHAYVTGSRLAPSQVLDRIVIALGASPAEQREWAEAWYRVGAQRCTGHGKVTVPGPRTPPPRQLPLGVDAFTGRAGELSQLDELLGTGQHGAVAALCGTAGVGKTALAVHWAQTRADRMPDGQLYLDLCGFDRARPMQPGHALARLLRALGLPDGEIAREIDERAAQYRSLVAGRRLLVLLDNASSTEQVRMLLPGPPACTVVTSRDDLAGLVARHGAHRIEVDLLPVDDARSLLETLVGPSDPAALTALAERCARLPLALRIAADLAVRRPQAPLAALVAELAAGHRELDLLEASDDPRTGLREVFSWSYQRLPAAPARAFRLLPRQPGGELTAAALAASAGVPAEDAQRALAALSRAHLVRQHQPGRYTAHALLLAYARELAAAELAPVDNRAAWARLADHSHRAAAPLPA